MKTTFTEFLAEAQSGKKEDKILEEILAEMGRRKMFPEQTQSDRQYNRGTLVLDFNYKKSPEFIERAFKIYDAPLPSSTILRQKLLERTHTGTSYTINSSGTIKHKTGPGYSYQFKTVKECVDWVEENAMHYIISDSMRYLDIKSSNKLEIPIKILSKFYLEKQLNIIEKYRELFPNSYKEISSDLLFFGILAKIRIGIHKIDNATIDLWGNNHKRNEMEVDVSATKNSAGLRCSFSNESSVSKQSHSVKSRMSVNFYSLRLGTTDYQYPNPFELSHDEQIIRKATATQNIEKIESLEHDMRGSIAGSKFNI